MHDLIKDIAKLMLDMHKKADVALNIQWNGVNMQDERQDMGKRYRINGQEMQEEH